MIVAIIPAQAKSKRLPGKNMKQMLGKPMLDYTIEYAKACKLVDEIYVSTDSKQIAEHAREQGVKVIMRPSKLCGDAAIVEVLKHCINSIPNSGKISRVVALQVDHPDRELDLTGLLNRAIEADAADMITVEPDGTRNGSVRILRKKDLMQGSVSHSIIAVPQKCTNIHTQADFERACEHLNRLKEADEQKI